jgi:hypothetical protein
MPAGLPATTPVRAPRGRSRMTLPLSSRLDESIPSASGLYHRLVLAVGPARTGKTGALTELADSKGWPRINVNLQLAERLLDLTQKQRAVRVAGLLYDIVKAAASNVLVASWPGSFDGQALTYAEPGHREFKKYAAPQAVIVSTADAQPTDVAAAQEENR